MSIDPKKFGLSNSLVDAVNEALKGDQHKIDANKNGKIDANDFKKLRGEQTAGEKEKQNYKHDMMKNEVADGNKANFKQNMKEDAEQIDELSKKTLGSYVTKASDKAATHTGAAAHYGSGGTGNNPAKMAVHQAIATKRRVGIQKAVGKLTKEEVVDEAAVAGTNVAADMDARKAEVQRKIAAKQASMQLAKSNKRISGSPSMKEAKCTCGEGKGSKMSCEACNSDKKNMKGGKEPIIMNPPLKEASNLPKAVVTKGHEIAKSLIKHRSKVKEPYAVGMAAAKKSAGIKEDAEQVDEISTMKAVRTAVKRQTNAYGDAIKRGDDLSDKEKHKVDRSQALIKKKYGEKGDKIVYKAVGKRIGYQD